MMNFRHGVSPLLILLAAGCTTPAPQAKVVDSGTTFAHDALEPYVENGELPGAIAIYYRNGVQETCCIGYADVAAKRPIGLDDVFMQCSQTKGFCGVTVAKLVEEGKLNLDDPVSKYLPEFRELWVEVSNTNGVRTLRRAKNALTVRMCLNHTGGFPFETVAKDKKIPGGGWSGGARLRQNAAVAAATPLLFDPGTDVEYSNTGIDVGAAVVEVVTGMKWEDYLKQTVLDPLGMKDTWFWPTDEQLAHRIEIYATHARKPAQLKRDCDWSQRPYNDKRVRFASAGAGLWPTANDQLKFYKMLMNLGTADNGARILKPETVTNLLTVSTRPHGTTARGKSFGGYSLGLGAPVEDLWFKWVGHTGAWNSGCFFNYHRKMLKLYVAQSVGGPRPWEREFDKAADKFFEKFKPEKEEYE